MEKQAQMWMIVALVLSVAPLLVVLLTETGLLQLHSSSVETQTETTSKVIAGPTAAPTCSVTATTTTDATWRNSLWLFVYQRHEVDVVIDVQASSDCGDTGDGQTVLSAVITCSGLRPAWGCKSELDDPVQEAEAELVATMEARLQGG